MKALGRSLFAVTTDASAKPRGAYTRVAAADMELPESWFRDAIFDCPDLVIGPCLEAGLVRNDEIWLPWATEFGCEAGSIDLLLISSTGRIAIVETKLSYNPGGRREVVAQVLEYALSLQESPHDELPLLPVSPHAPDIADVHECMSKGQFLLIVAGDELDSRAVKLSEALLAGHLTSEWDLAMVDLNVFRSVTPGAGVLIVPELRGRVVAETRQVVRVQVEGTTPRATISVERVPPPVEPTPQRQPHVSVAAFLLHVQKVAPDLAKPIAKIVERFQQINGAGDGQFVLGLKASTANLYWRPSSGSLRRVFAMGEAGRFRIWLHYVLQIGRDDLAALIRERSQPLLSIPANETSRAVMVNEGNVATILSVVDAVVAAVSNASPEGR